MIYLLLISVVIWTYDSCDTNAFLYILLGFCLENHFRCVVEMTLKTVMLIRALKTWLTIVVFLCNFRQLHTGGTVVKGATILSAQLCPLWNLWSCLQIPDLVSWFVSTILSTLVCYQSGNSGFPPTWSCYANTITLLIKVELKHTNSLLSSRTCRAR